MMLVPLPSPFLRSLKTPAKIGFLAALLTALVTLFIPNRYQSVARILPADTRGVSGLGQFAAAAATMGVSIPGQENAEAAYVDILKSRWMMETLLNTSFRFHVRSWRFGSETLRQETLLHFMKAKNLDRGVKALNKVVSVSRDFKSKLITVQVETISPELSQQVCRRAVTLLDEFLVRRSTTRGGAKADFAALRLKEAREEMTQAEDAFRAFLSANRNYQVSADPSVRLKGARLEGELSLKTQVVTTLAIAREQALLEEKDDIPILNILDPGNLPVEKSRPSRSATVMFMFALVGAAAWLWLNREWLRNLLSENLEDVNPKRAMRE